ncbi:cadmium-translocating P-type ATPase [Apibacter muscae]|uniref:P-type Zn(2+) transporter n=1 Tax=Apibacter muscae TaxID=2509004 RepID=A0A563DIA6_9FLAO|nr:heavy metal translocating P-type ATPase [Apibacter muscae]TWP24813.1 cadmium-translocating P-type ATPase [Apibacter muscae]TWP29867.1 cadmium-translocating P-type ATPase [Apibacter muscae]
MSKACCNTQIYSHKTQLKFLKSFLPAIVSLLILIVGSILNSSDQSWFKGWIKFAYYIVAYIPVGFPVIKEAWESIKKGQFFSEFLLMSIATLGAFAIGEYPEGVTVMLFYSVGEALQDLAVSKAKNNIKSLLDQRPDSVTVVEKENLHVIPAKEVKAGSIIQLKPGEKLALDGQLLSEKALLDTSSLTGESAPQIKYKSDSVFAGMINLNTVIQVCVTSTYDHTKLSKILELVQSATSKKAPTELFIRKFAKIYTPMVVFLAISICFLPIFFTSDYQFKEWLYKALIFLVISCPCALVISIPLGYFGGIGAASRHGILFKGSSYLDKIAGIQNIVLDKTGTITEGSFKVQEVNINPKFNLSKIIQYVNAIENLSTHPIATAIKEYAGEVNMGISVQKVEEFPGMGIKAEIEEAEILVGNFKLLDKFNIYYDAENLNLRNTIIAIAYKNEFVGYISISDQIKADAAQTIKELMHLGIKVTMLSGDKSSVVKEVANALNIEEAYGNLYPEEKVKKLEEIINFKESVAFVGDGVNDAPALALSDVGIAMGGLGSDAAIEIADVVIQDDKPSKIPVALKIGKKTKQIVWQNIILAFTIKIAVLILGAGGFANMWEAIFADVGVALLAIANAIRIQRMNF